MGQRAGGVISFGRPPAVALCVPPTTCQAFNQMTLNRKCRDGES